MTPRVGYQSYLSNTLDYRESAPIEPARLDALVARLRAGDRTVKDEIIKGHYRLVAAIVGDRVRSKSRHDDCLAAALLALAEAVEDSAPGLDPETGGVTPGRLYNNNITYYITACVKYAIRDEIACAHTVKVPGRTVRKRLSQGELFEAIVPCDRLRIMEDAPDRTSDLSVENGETRHSGAYALPFHIPASKPLVESPEFKEALARAIVNPTQQAIVSLRAQGYSYKEVGERVGLSTPRVGQIMAEIEPRFDAYFRS